MLMSDINHTIAAEMKLYARYLRHVVLINGERHLAIGCGFSCGDDQESDSEDLQAFHADPLHACPFDAPGESTAGWRSITRMRN